MENWIRKAFNEAEEDSKEIQWATEIAEEFMEKESAGLLDAFCAQLPEKLVKRLAKIFTTDEELSVAIQDLCGSFFLSGFMTGYNWEEDEED